MGRTFKVVLFGQHGLDLVGHGVDLALGLLQALMINLAALHGQLERRTGTVGGMSPTMTCRVIHQRRDNAFFHLMAGSISSVYWAQLADALHLTPELRDQWFSVSIAHLYCLHKSACYNLIYSENSGAIFRGVAALPHDGTRGSSLRAVRAVPRRVPTARAGAAGHLLPRVSRCHRSSCVLAA